MDDATAPHAGADEPMQPTQDVTAAGGAVPDPSWPVEPGAPPAAAAGPAAAPRPHAAAWTPPGGIAPGTQPAGRGWVRWVAVALVVGVLLFGALILLQAPQSTPPGARVTGTALPPALRASDSGAATPNTPNTPVPAGAPAATVVPGAPGATAVPAAPVPAAAAPESTILGASAGLKAPRGVGVDSAGHVYIGDAGNHRVVRLDTNGSVLGTWGTASLTVGPGNFNLLGDLAVAADGQLVTIDATGGDVQGFTADGKSRFQALQVASSPSGIALGPDGRIWVADTAGSRVVRLSADGKPDAVFTGGPAAPARFEQPVDVALAPDGTAYVIDLRRRIARLDGQGQVTQSWPIALGLARGASHLAFWRNQVVWTDPDRNRLGLLDPASGAVRYVGQEGTAPGQFRVPTGIGAGPGDKLYVVDSDNARVQVFSTLDQK